MPLKAMEWYVLQLILKPQPVTLILIPIAYMTHIFSPNFISQVVGKFNDESGNVATRDVDVGRPHGIPCPAHGHSNNVNYKWEYKEANQFVSLPPSKRTFVTKDGTLYFSTVKAEDITDIDQKGGIYCRQEATVGRSTEARPSSPIKLRVRSTGMLLLIRGKRPHCPRQVVGGHCAKAVTTVGKQWADSHPKM